jgi:alkanesulfonate monooxygenase SsuD/methylene tetrahydromethanopterin reductase-like flavin-dependent oxidoreductase (luciferase family)
MSEILEMLPKAWSGDPFTHRGDVYEFPTLAVRPTPHRTIPVVIGGGAEAAVRRAARLADGFFSNAPPHKFVEQVQWANDEMEKTGRNPSTFRWIYYSILCPGSDADAAWGEYGDHVWALTWKYSDMEASATRPLPAAEPPAAPSDAIERIRTRSVVLGSTQEIVDRLNALRTEAGVPVEFMARSFFPTLPHARQVELLDHLAADVMPHV